MSTSEKAARVMSFQLSNVGRAASKSDLFLTRRRLEKVLFLPTKRTDFELPFLCKVASRFGLAREYMGVF